MVEIHHVMVKKVTYTRPEKPEGDPKLTVTLEIDSDHLEMAKRLLQFAEAGPATWSVDIHRELGAS